jgi:RNA polymerase-binding protein DksA
MASLNKDQLKRIEEQLRERQHKLVDEFAEKRHEAATTSTEDVIGGVGDPGDESVAREQLDLSIEERSRDAEELQGIESALERISDGSYGYCDDCGGEIDYRRLEVQPTAVRCVECQAKHEKTFAHKGTPTM